jgi:GTP-binding protein
MSKELPTDLPVLFISAVTGQGLTELKDLLWREINDESNQLAAATMTHRSLDPHHRDPEEDNFIFSPEEMPEDELITDEDWTDEFWEEESSVNE